MTYNFHQPHLNISLIIKRKLLQKTFEQVYSHYPNEFGGIFLGKINSLSSTAEITDILVPTKYDNSKSGFKRYSESLNKKIAQKYNESNKSIHYLGEWHSHPLNSPIPSNKDYSAMVNLSSTTTIALKTPVLLIISYTIQQVFSPRFYIMYNKKFYNYEQL